MTQRAVVHGVADAHDRPTQQCWFERKFCIDAFARQPFKRETKLRFLRAIQLDRRTNLAGEPRDTVLFDRTPTVHAQPLPPGTRPDFLLLRFDEDVFPVHEILHREAFPKRIVDSVEPALF